ncbi:hypothetical protein E308F_12510 [Moorella sp. E308F]|nr:hypothetical protein E308F_12510 [Moorella sp. E308F]
MIQGIFVLEVQVGKFFKEVNEILEGIYPILFCCFYNTVSNGAGFGAPRGVGKQPVLAADDERLDGTLAAVVVEFQTPVLQEGYEFIPLAQAIVNRLPKSAFGQYPGFLVFSHAKKASSTGRLRTWRI